MERLRLGISACLLGENVRYDGGHKRDRFLTDTLAKFVEYVPVCPEVECGMSTPREAMRLWGDANSPRLITVSTEQDLTEMMVRWSRQRTTELAGEMFDGFIFKSRSPSCGMNRVKVYEKHRVPRQRGSGIFAREFMRRFPLIPVEEEERLKDPSIRENFIERIFVCQRFRQALALRATRGKLVGFHTAHKLLILSHSTKYYQQLGRLVAGTPKLSLPDMVEQYLALLMEALELQATPAKHTNVLHHIMGYFKKQLSADEKAELLEVIDSFKQGNLPLIVPCTLLGHYVRKYHQGYLKDQVYLYPHPRELQMRNHS